MMDNFGTINFSVEDGIGVIEFYHPKSNSLPSGLLNKLVECFNKSADDKACRVIILKSGKGGSFCAGASFDELISIKDFKAGKEFFMGFARVINSMRKCPQCIITRVHGKAVGGGVGLIAACDYSFALNSAAVKLSELAVGIGPFVIGPAVERKIGKASLMEMILDSEWKSAAWGLEKGIFNKICESEEELDSEVTSLATKLAGSNFESMREIKKMLWKGTDGWDELLEHQAEISSAHVLSEYTKNFINEFKSKGK